MTILFSDGFESGDFSAWTGTFGSPYISSVNFHHGNYSLEASDDTSQSGCYKDFTPSTEIYARIYVKTEGYIPIFQHSRVLQLNREGGWAPECYLRFIGDTDSSRYQVHVNTADGVSGYYNFDWSNGWNCYELHVDMSDYTNVTTQLFVNDVLVINITGGTTGQIEANSHIGRVTCGQIWDNNANINVFHDCVVVSDSYIGPESSGPRFYGDGLSWVVLR